MVSGCECVSVVLCLGSNPAQIPVSQDLSCVCVYVFACVSVSVVAVQCTPSLQQNAIAPSACAVVKTSLMCVCVRVNVSTVLEAFRGLLFIYINRFIDDTQCII